MVTADKDESLKRLGGGRWQTRDERFTIEPQSGTWVVVDAEQTDDLGLPLVRGPFGSLGAAKTAIEGARGAEPAASPLAAKLRNRPRPGSANDDRPSKRSMVASDTKSADAAPPTKPTKAGKRPEAEPPAEPRWVQALEPAERRAAKRLIDRLTAAGAPDPEGVARRDIVGEVPAVAAFAIAQAIRALGDAAAPADVAGLLAGGRDEKLDVRWRLVDGEDRPITLDFKDR